MLSEVFKNVVMRVSLDRRPPPDTHVAAFVERLRGTPSLFFTADPQLEASVAAEDNASEGEQEEETQALP